MKKYSRILLAFLTSAALALPLTACGSNQSQTGSSVSSVSSSEEYTKEVDSISQEDWDSHRQKVKLSTGIEMSYVEMGDPDGKPLILQHGMTDNSRVWSQSAPYFAKAGYHVYMPDLRGHGYSDKPESGMYTLTNYADDLNAFMEAKGIEKADLVGHSLGSLTMQAFMFMYPERCDHVVLLASAPVDDKLGDALMSTYDMAVDLKDDEHPNDEFMDAWYTMDNPVDETCLKYVKKESQQLPAYAWRAISAGAVAMNLEALYPNFDSSIPTMIMHGTKDSFFDAATQKKLQKELPFAEYKEYKGIGHNVELEAPKRMANDLMDFFEK